MNLLFIALWGIIIAVRLFKFRDVILFRYLLLLFLFIFCYILYRGAMLNDFVAIGEYLFHYFVILHLKQSTNVLNVQTEL